jgi:hypothetical protein
MKKILIALGITILVVLAIILLFPRENNITPQVPQPQISGEIDTIPHAELEYDPDFPPGSYEAYMRDLASGENLSGESGEPII